MLVCYIRSLELPYHKPGLIEMLGYTRSYAVVTLYLYKFLICLHLCYYLNVMSVPPCTVVSLDLFSRASLWLAFTMSRTNSVLPSYTDVCLPSGWPFMKCRVMLVCCIYNNKITWSPSLSVSETLLTSSLCKSYSQSMLTHPPFWNKPNDNTIS